MHQSFRVARIAVKKVCNLHGRQEGPLGQNILIATRSIRCTLSSAVQHRHTFREQEAGYIPLSNEKGIATYRCLFSVSRGSPSRKQFCIVSHGLDWRTYIQRRKHSIISPAEIDSERHPVADTNDNGCGKNRQDPKKGTSLVPILVQAMDEDCCCCSNIIIVVVILRGRRYHEMQYRREDRTEEEQDPDSNAQVALQ
jgi:hypothetical protein